MTGSTQPVTLSGEGETEKVWAGSTDAYIFDVLGVRPALGRTFAPDDIPVAGRSSPIILSHKFWKTRLGGTPDVLQRTLRIGGGARTIIGVMPERFWLDPWDADVTFLGIFRPRQHHSLDDQDQPPETWRRARAGGGHNDSGRAVVRTGLGGDTAWLRAPVMNLREAYSSTWFRHSYFYSKPARSCC